MGGPTEHEAVVHQVVTHFSLVYPVTEKTTPCGHVARGSGYEGLGIRDVRGLLAQCTIRYLSPLMSPYTTSIASAGN
jgi:hypothetical protein